jgi:hypothetical protein
VRKLLFLLSFWLAVVFSAAAAEPVSLTFTEGGSVSGDIIKLDDNGLMLRVAGENYVTTNVAWSRLSQDTLKQLVANPKIKPLAEVFIEPAATAHATKSDIKINPVTRLARPETASFLGGLVGSTLGKVLLLIVWLANLYAAYEVSIIRARPAIQVVGLAAVLPVAGPVIFLALPIRMEKPPESKAESAVSGQPLKPQEEIQIVEASWKQAPEKKMEPQIFARGKFTFNKRFVETKFAGYIGTPQGDALKFTMEVKTNAAQFAIERIAQVAATDVIFETPNGQVTVALTDIQEVKLVPLPPPAAAA